MPDAPRKDRLLTEPVPADSSKAAAYASITASELAEDAARQAGACAQGEVTAAGTAEALAGLAEPLIELLVRLGDTAKAEQVGQALGHAAEAVRQMGSGFADLQKRFQAHGEAWTREATVWRHIVSVGDP